MLLVALFACFFVALRARLSRAACCSPSAFRSRRRLAVRLRSTRLFQAYERNVSNRSRRRKSVCNIRARWRCTTTRRTPLPLHPSSRPAARPCHCISHRAPPLVLCLCTVHLCTALLYVPTPCRAVRSEVSPKRFYASTTVPRIDFGDFCKKFSVVSMGKHQFVIHG